MREGLVWSLWYWKAGSWRIRKDGVQLAEANRGAKEYRPGYAYICPIGTDPQSLDSLHRANR